MDHTVVWARGKTYSFALAGSSADASESRKAIDTSCFSSVIAAVLIAGGGGGSCSIVGSQDLADVRVLRVYWDAHVSLRPEAVV